jgi:hypothetical protein
MLIWHEVVVRDLVDTGMQGSENGVVGAGFQVRTCKFWPSRQVTTLNKVGLQ